MLMFSVLATLVLLATVYGATFFRERRVAMAASAWPFLLPWLCGLEFPTVSLNALLVGLGGLACGAFGASRRVFVLTSVVATLVAYGIGSYRAADYARQQAARFPYESMEERLS